MIETRRSTPHAVIGGFLLSADAVTTIPPDAPPFTGHIAKPLEPAELIATVATLTRR